MKKKTATVVPVLKYAQANEDFVEHLSMFIREHAVTLTEVTEPLTGAVVVLYGKDSMKTMYVRVDTGAY